MCDTNVVQRYSHQGPHADSCARALACMQAPPRMEHDGDAGGSTESSSPKRKHRANPDNPQHRHSVTERLAIIASVATAAFTLHQHAQQQPSSGAHGQHAAATNALPLPIDPDVALPKEVVDAARVLLQTHMLVEGVQAGAAWSMEPA